MSYSTGSHTVFYHRYHIVWITKYRYKVLQGNRLQPEPLRRRVAGVPDDDAELFVGHDRLAEAELGDRGRDHGHGLLIAARIARIRDDPVDRDLDDVHGCLFGWRQGRAAKAKRSRSPRPFRFGAWVRTRDAKKLNELAGRPRRNDRHGRPPPAGRKTKCPPTPISLFRGVGGL